MISNVQAIQVHELTKIFGAGSSQVAALQGVDMTLKTGEFLAVMGPSGCGKSTLLHLIGGLDTPTSGKVVIENVNLMDLNDDQLTILRRKQFGFVFQAFNLLDVLTALENVAIPLLIAGAKDDAAKSQALEALCIVEMDDRADHLPTELSGGQQQRLAIARALVTKPLVLLADEPTGNLDSRSSDQIMQVIEKSCGRSSANDTHGHTQPSPCRHGGPDYHHARRKSGRRACGRISDRHRQHPSRPGDLAMNVTFWKFSASHIRARPLRSILTLLGISIGIATAVAVSMMTQTMRTVHERMFDSLMGKASLEVVADGFAGFASSWIDRVEQLPEIDTAVGVIQVGAAMATKSGPVPVMCLAVDARRDSLVRAYRFREGGPIKNHSEILVTATMADSHDLSIGDEIQLIAFSGTPTWRVAGILEASTAARFNGGAVMFVRLEDGQDEFSLPGKVNGLHLIPHGDDQEAIEAVTRILPAGLQVQATKARGALAKEATMNLNQILSVMGVVSLVAGAFVILNTFRMNLEERRQQFAILRALGATSTQLSNLLLREAIGFGLVGTVLGIVLGWGIAHLLLPGLGAMIGVNIGQLYYGRSIFIVAFLMGPVVAIAATYYPAKRAGRRRLLSDLLSRRVDTEKDHRVWPQFVGLAMLLFAVAVDVLFFVGLLPRTLGLTLLPLAMVFVVTGTILILPLFLAPLYRWAAWCLVHMMRTESMLALRELRRHESRSALTIGIVVVAICMTIGPGNEITSAMRSLYRWFDNVASADFFIQGSLIDVGFSMTPGQIPNEFVEEIRAMDGIDDVAPGTFVPTRIGRQPVLVVATSYSPQFAKRLNTSRHSPPDVVQRIADGEVAIGTNLARMLNLKIGDTIPLATQNGDVDLRVAGTTSEYHAGGVTVHMHIEKARQLFGIQGAQVLSITSRHGEVAKVQKQLEAYCRANSLLLSSFAEFRVEMDERIDDTIGFLWVLMALIFLVATLAIVNTLAMNVLDQVREIGILRAIGMRRQQVRRLILAQALVIGMVSLPPGVALGLAVAILMNLPTEFLTGHEIPLAIHWHVVFGAAGTGLAVAVIAALIPSRYAARLSIIRAIRFQ